MDKLKIVHLLTTGGREAELIKAVLEDNDIAVIVRHDEFGGYSMIYMGFSAYNVELYVAEDDYERAKELLVDLNIKGEEVGSEEAFDKNKISREEQDVREQKNRDFNKADNVQEKEADEENDKTLSYYLIQAAKIIIIFYLLFNLFALFF